MNRALLALFICFIIEILSENLSSLLCYKKISSGTHSFYMALGSKIQIIDDEKDSNKSIQRFLEEKGYIAFACENTVDGMEAFEKQKPNLLILDVVINKKPDGLNLLSILKSNPDHHHLPVIVLTKNSMVLGMDVQAAIADDRFNPNVTFLAKPIKNGELYLKILNLLEIKE